MIPVTKPFLPPIDEYNEYLDGIWSRNWLTNSGPLVKMLETELKNYFSTERFLFLSNGTIALQFAIKALQLKGEIITTPFSYVATTSSIVWEGCKPVFVDIDPNSWNIDPSQIRSAITNRTSAVLATHVFGNPCAIESIQKIAKEYNLKVIYDAAHCFGSEYDGKSVLQYGDISTISFHATKLFHTIEGGGIVAQQKEAMTRIAYLRNFGHDGFDKFNGVGINGKNSEFHAAMGLVNLKYAEKILLKRKNDHQIYNKYLSEINLYKPVIEERAKYNFSYFPVVFETEQDRLKVFNALSENDILPRRYFYPLLSNLDYVEKVQTPIAQSVSNKILCLPLFFQISEDEIKQVCNVIIKTLM